MSADIWLSAKLLRAVQFNLSQCRLGLYDLQMRYACPLMIAKGPFIERLNVLYDLIRLDAKASYLHRWNHGFFP